MRKETLSDVFARNLRAAMRDYQAGAGITQAALAKASKVSQTAISLYLTPRRRHATEGRSKPGPTLERVGMLADALKIEPWLLLHPNMEQALREHAMYRKIEEEYRKLPPAVVPLT